MAYRGSGIARAGGLVYFVPETCPGELVEARETVRRKNRAEAVVEEVVEPSPDRLAEPDCRIAPRPGSGDAPVRVPGCVYDHMSHDAELRCKERQLADFLSRQAGVPDAASLLRPSFRSPRHLHFRNKTVMHVAREAASGRWILGYVGDDNRTVVDVPRCPLSVPEIADAFAAARADDSFWRWAGEGARVAARWTK
ncbi:MAG: hypothetical protein IJ678_02695, partial [Kiritimatiellae bacterium]|nr:hypothetical protein [Kiritimatiellia bacterium]